MQLIDVEELKKALGFEPLNSIKTDGLIDRKTVIDFLSGITNLDPKVKGSLMMYIMSLPDMQPKRKRGKWKPLRVSLFLCSECCAVSKKGTENFCPRCGADMRGGGAE